MKKITTGILSFVLMFMLCNPVFAYDYNDNGYYNKNIFIQNNLTKYSAEFSQAVNSWNNANVLERSIVVNTVSDSYIINFNYGEDEDYWLDYYNHVYGIYEAFLQLSYACSCHKTTAFRITLNENEFDNFNYSSATDLSNVRSSVIVHELGHAYGLIDYEYGEYWTSSVMDYYRDMTIIYQPQARDVNNANACWQVHWED